MAKADHYSLLGVAKDATAAEIRTAYESARKTVGTDGDRSIALADAFATLTDPQKRIFYDQQLYVASTLPARRTKEQVAAAAPAPRIKPRDAATLVIVESTDREPRVLMGRRRDDLVFMPGKYVFPGGRVDKEDRLIEPADPLDAAEVRRLLHQMRGYQSALRARAIALAAVREAFEEAGLVIGSKAAASAAPKSESWAAFYGLGFAPRLAPLRLFARAITPPGRPRRFDTRFFCVDATEIAHREAVADGELSGLHWMTFDEARALDVPHITRVVLEDLTDRMRYGPLTSTTAPVPFYHHKNGSFHRDLIPGD
jgi:8-oxo-dGTP pyrophosphatase MutT (NUDIX family)